MFVAKLIVFVSSPPTEFQTKAINTLLKYGYTPFVDSVNCNRQWFVKNMKTPHRLFQMSNVFCSYQISDWTEEKELLRPDICLYYNEDCPITEDEFYQISGYFKILLLEDRELEGPKTFLQKPVVLKRENSETIHDPAIMENYYFFRKVLIEEKDVMIFEVTKPFCDRPYTTLVRDFSINGSRDFFTNLFISSSWGICREDINFLAYCWRQLEMAGDFDLDGLMKAHVERCTPQEGRIPDNEPEVYRKPIEAVLEHLERKYQGFVL